MYSNNPDIQEIKGMCIYLSYLSKQVYICLQLSKYTSTYIYIYMFIVIYIYLNALHILKHYHIIILYRKRKCLLTQNCPHAPSSQKNSTTYEKNDKKCRNFKFI
jgi:hypothetical protein